MSSLPVTPSSDALHRANGIDIHATIWVGAGPPLVLIHGISGTAASWWPLVDELATQFTPIALDLRGHGASGSPPHGYLYGDYCADLDALLDALDIERPLIVGHSLGGLVALWWARTHPDRAAALVIVDSPLRSGEDFMPAFDRWLALNAMTVDEAAAAYAAEFPGWSAELCRHRAAQMTTTARNVFTELRADSLANHGVDRIAEIAAINSPVLLVHGDPEAGSMVHPTDAAELDARLVNATSVRIPGASHGVHIEHRDEFLAVALPFLSMHASATSEAHVVTPEISDQASTG
ncbi:MAG: alpha/beta hydrolase [Chloroflexia bacterium]|nr:alpha/beta hydrolase [Chloroflexia bacterium]